MSQLNAHVLVVGPWEGRGGIASVMQMHRQTAVWKTMHCRELSTFRDGTRTEKTVTALKAYLKAPGLVMQAAIVHVHLAGGVSCLRKLPVLACAKLLRKPIIVHIHAASVSSLTQPGFGWAVKSVFRMATHIVALSGSWARDLRPYAGETPIAVIPNPVKVPSSSERETSVKHKPVILFSGKLETRKGYHLLLQAAQALIQEFPSLQIWLAGNGETAEATRLAETLGIKSSVRILGWVDEITMDALLRNATISCLPSYNEGVPMAILEAMSHSLPVVTTPVGGLPELIKHGENGMFAAVGDVESLRANLLLLLRDPELRARIGQQAGMTVNRECGLDKVSDEIEHLYQAVLSSDCKLQVESYRERKQHPRSV